MCEELYTDIFGIFRRKIHILNWEHRLLHRVEDHGEQHQHTDYDEDMMQRTADFLIDLLMIRHHDAENHQDRDRSRIDQHLHDTDKFRLQHDIDRSQTDERHGERDDHMDHLRKVQHEHRAADCK